MAFPAGMSGDKQRDAIVVGDLFIDLILTGFPALPGLGEEGFAAACRRETGGGVANTSCGLAKLGLRTALLAIAGADEMEWFGKRFAAHGVDTSMLIAHATEATAITVAVSTPQDRIFYTYYGPNGELPALLEQRETRERLATARHVHFAFPVPPRLLADLGRWLRERGTSTSIDVGWQEGWLADPASMEALSEVDWFLPNDHEAARLTGATSPEGMLAWMRTRGVRGASVKLGAQGSAVCVDGECRVVPSIAVTPVDTTGAGDCFNAGFLYGVLRGLPLAECLRIANVCGALSTQAAGGIAGFPGLEEFQGR
jgi:sugar/nucleoside kinase (ribokinase family)